MNNDSVIDLAKKINKELLDLPLIKEYQELEKIILNDKVLKNIDYELRKAQKDMVEHSTQNDYNIYQNNYVILKETIKNNPLFQNYLSLKEDVQNLLNQVSALIKKDL